MLKLFTILIIKIVLVLLINSINGNNDQLFNTSVTTNSNDSTTNYNDSNTSINSIRGYINQFKSQQNNNNDTSKCTDVVLGQSLAMNDTTSIIINHRNLQGGVMCPECDSPFKVSSCDANEIKINFKVYLVNGECISLCCDNKSNCCKKIAVSTGAPQQVPVPQPITVPVPVPQPIPGVAPIPVPVPISTPGEQPIPQIVLTQPTEQAPTEVLPASPESFLSPVDASSPNPIPAITNLPATLGNDIVQGSSTTNATTATATTISSSSSVSTGVYVGVVIGLVVIILFLLYFLLQKKKKNQTNNDTTARTAENEINTNSFCKDNDISTIDAAAETASASATTKTKKDRTVPSKNDRLAPLMDTTNRKSTPILPSAVTTSMQPSENDIVSAITDDVTQNDSVNKNSIIVLPNALTTNMQLLDDADDDDDNVSGITDDVTSNASGYTVPTRTTISSNNSRDIPLVTGSIVSGSTTSGGINTAVLSNTLLGDFYGDDYTINNDEEKSLFSKTDASEF